LIRLRLNLKATPQLQIFKSRPLISPDYQFFIFFYLRFRWTEQRNSNIKGTQTISTQKAIFLQTHYMQVAADRSQLARRKAEKKVLAQKSFVNNFLPPSPDSLQEIPYAPFVLESVLKVGN
jgi:hypothetical protein